MKLKLGKWKGVIEVLVTVLGSYMALQAFQLALQASLSISTPLMYVPTRSMEPNIQVGDLVVIKGVKPSEVQVGDIIVFRTGLPPPTDRVIHRVVEISNESGKLYFTTQGDNVGYPQYFERHFDAEERLIGKCIFRIPLLGYLWIWTEPYEIKIFILVTFFAFLAWWIWEEMPKEGKKPIGEETREVSKNKEEEKEKERKEN
ncbi:signal peptidase I [Candidatus Bathyarchaeota archaeon]|nr:signal peptidase I [Candidatus Bathyarchaeota archaeon]